MDFKRFLGRLDQQKIVFAITVILFVVFCIFLNGFASPSNLLSFMQSVAIIGVLGLAMALVIIGRGIDLSIIAVMIMPIALCFVMISNGVSVEVAFLVALAIAIVVGVVNGVIVAYLEVPAIFATLATGMVTYGAMQLAGVTNDVVRVPDALGWMGDIFQGQFYGVPKTVIFFAVVSVVVWAVLRHTVYGRFIYAIGDNPQAARTSGLPVRPIMVLQYVAAAVIALAAGIVLTATVDSANSRLFNSTMIYDVVLIVVLGGISLGGGRGSISNVLVGTLLIGLLINGMTIMNLEYETQNLIKATILLVALVVDGLINPRDEQTSQQGDI